MDSLEILYFFDYQEYVLFGEIFVIFSLNLIAKLLGQHGSEFDFFLIKINLMSH